MYTAISVSTLHNTVVCHQGMLFWFDLNLSRLSWDDVFPLPTTSSTCTMYINVHTLLHYIYTECTAVHLVYQDVPRQHFKNPVRIVVIFSAGFSARLENFTWQIMEIPKIVSVCLLAWNETWSRDSLNYLVNSHTYVHCTTSKIDKNNESPSCLSKYNFKKWKCGSEWTMFSFLYICHIYVMLTKWTRHPPCIPPVVESILNGVDVGVAQRRRQAPRSTVTKQNSKDTPVSAWLCLYVVISLI